MTREEQIVNECAKERSVSEERAFKKGAEWADRTMIDRACEWLETNLEYSSQEISKNHQDWFIEMFKKAMEQ